MTTKIFTLLVAALLISSMSFATIRRVGYSGPQLVGVDYTSLENAYTDAVINDTIQLYPGGDYAFNYAGTALSKRLVFIGDGYLLDKNNGLQVATSLTRLSLIMDAGANGSIFEGLEVSPAYYSDNYGFTGTTAINGTLQNILFKRCSFITGNFFYLQYAGDSVKNIIFSECYFKNTQSANFTSNSTAGIKGIDFQNCILDNIYPNFYYTNGGTIGNVSFENCSMGSYGEIQNASSISCYFRNCIIRGEPSGANNDVFDYCIFETNNPPPHFVTGTGDEFGKLFTDIFQGDLTQGTQWDSSYILKSGSPAIGYGRDLNNNAINAGAFGGVNPYKLSGVPNVPAFYKITAPGSAATSNPYTITFSVRANN